MFTQTVGHRQYFLGEDPEPDHDAHAPGNAVTAASGVVLLVVFAVYLFTTVVP